MTTPADVLEVMTIVAACHHRTAPRMDDREAVLVTAGIWADLFTEYRLNLADLIAAVKKRALTHAEAPEPAEIIQFARAIRRDRTEHESDAEREARQDQRDAELANRERLAAAVDPLAQSKGIDRA